MPRPASAENIENAVRDYIAGEGCEAVAARYGTSQDRLKRILVERGLWRTKTQMSQARARRTSAGLLSKSTLPDQEIVDRYLAGATRLELANAYGTSRTAIDYRLKAAGVTLRTLAEQNRINSAQRTPEQNAANARAAHAAVRGRAQSSLHRERIAQTRERLQTHASDDELYMAALLADRGVKVTPQKAVGRYNVDIATGSVAVEIFGGGWHAYGSHKRRTPERVRYILDQGWNLVIVWNLPHRWPMTGAAADYVVSFAEETSRDPTIRGQYRVIWSDGQVVPSADLEVDDLTLKPSRSGRKRTRATNNGTTD